ncbi:M20 family metallo-hydrolase [Halomonas binhaiensis]|uniref:M20 family metallo-hydrolase n=1 Tax=Halomonas binhaiensis TaxID=2562282 RepID=A0A856QVZ8_9GAMM|nr:M20 family metallo-hydrolase [Halomonas binhaiensis]
MNADRLWASLLDMARIGPSPNGGSRRLALTAEDVAGRRLLLDWAEALGCRWRSDAAGNLFIRRDGEEPGLDPVAMGSHLDTQPLGGRFDGVLGVLAGLEVLRTLHERQIRTRRALELVVWTNEEGSRFSPAMGGSGAWTGRLPLEQFLAAADKQGISLGSALAESGQAGTLAQGEPNLDAYFELHIEQGPVLEEQGQPMAVVNGVQGIRWYDLIFRGQSAHAGPTPMNYRHDPLMAATAFIHKLRQTILADSSQAARLTVGDIEVADPSRNAVPEVVRLSVDIRHIDDGQLEYLHEQLIALARSSAALEGVEVDVEPVWHSPVTHFDSTLVSAVQDAAEQRGYSIPIMMSGAGHDAVNLSHVTPTVMIFIPCRDGISHNEAEYAEPQHCALGTQLLCDAVLQRANRD